MTDGGGRIYLDNAATSWPKPEAVYAAVDRYQRELGVAVGRGATRRGAELQSIVDRCRQRAARLFNASSPQQIVFTFNGTDSLNLALHGVLRQGDHVVSTVAEHNSVLRPLREMQDRLGIDVTLVDVDGHGRIDPDAIAAAMRDETALVAITHASNVTGVIQPVEEVGRIVADSGALLLVDAAQTAGHLPIDVAQLQVDLLACPGHKGLLGPLGTGLLYCREGLEERLRPIRQGGTGSRSEDDRQPEALPDRYESGNHNAPGLIGLEQGLAWLEGQEPGRLRVHEIELTKALHSGLAAIENVVVYGPAAEERVGVVSFNLEGMEPQVVAGLLDESFGIETRAGLHCAPRMHEAMGTAVLGGTVRMSVGPMTTFDEIETAIVAVQQLARAF
ncbi:putative cysteine desulfurase [Maioricimonas rarisocia]|uniref:cysteine desulfurase n=1 Tax=Maioricimonas rarisocia TaxID=2528026 RepID=A0A517ZBQ6_9PLAN|nr:aminotransferase class V-fold PLP-dependent enzyme [Maioricimonas rarisocia]QDU39869.1 putative cysteine desulfurase [Maioricimonas rarisocia]